MTPIEKAVAQLGGANEVLRLFGGSWRTIPEWKYQGWVPAEYCPRIEHLTGIRCEELNDRVEWSLIRGTAPASDEVVATLIRAGETPAGARRLAADARAATHAENEFAAELRRAITETRIVFESEPVAKDVLNYLEAVLVSAPTGGAIPPPHADDQAVDFFAQIMKTKLTLCRAKGRSGWDDPAHCAVEHLVELLLTAVEKGDPIDIANFAMMIHARGAVPELISQGLRDRTTLPGSYKSADELFATIANAPIPRATLADGIGSTRRMFADDVAAQAALDRLEFCLDLLPSEELACAHTGAGGENVTEETLAAAGADPVATDSPSFITGTGHGPAPEGLITPKPPQSAADQAAAAMAAESAQKWADAERSFAARREPLTLQQVDKIEDRMLALLAEPLTRKQRELVRTEMVAEFRALNAMGVQP